jgi:Ca-activated chloride channel homolog
MARTSTSNLISQMRPVFAAGLFIVFAGATLLPAAAQKQGEEHIRVGVQLVVLDVTVKDKNGQIMGGLDKKDFIVREDGAEQKVEEFSRDELPLAVALVVDTSGSIKPFLEPLREATTTALSALKPEDSVTLFTFSSVVEQKLPLTTDKKSIAGKLEGIEAGGSTNINGALVEAATDLVKEAPGQQRVIVLVSDNVPTDPGGISAEEVTRRVVASGAAVYSLKVPGENPLEMIAMMNKMKSMKQRVNVAKLVEETGGEVFDAKNGGAVDEQFRELIQRIKTRYTLGYYATPGNKDRLYHKLDVQLAAQYGKKGQNYLLLSKSGYYTTQ